MGPPRPVSFLGIETRRTPHDPMIDAVLAASRVLVAVAARSVGDLGEESEVTLTQYRLLMVLATLGPQGVASLASALGVTPPNVSRLCDRLVRKGLVRRRTRRQDRRQVRIELSTTGRQLVDLVTARRRAEIAELVEAVPEDARRSVVAGLQLLIDAAKAPAPVERDASWEL